METVLRCALAAVLAYLLGNFTTGLFVGKLFAGVDIRKYGSGNVGTTNMLRTMGYLPSILTFLGDGLKAVLAIVLGRLIAGEPGAMIAAVCVVAGHIWPVFFGFKGGKGAASSLGALLFLQPVVGLIVLALAVIVIGISRMVSVASISLGVLCVLINGVLCAVGMLGIGYVLYSLAIVIMVLYAHRENFKRLIAGKESKLDFGKIKGMNRKV